MVVAAGLLVLVGLALFLGGVVTGSEGLYWACVAVCGVAAAVLVVGWVRAPRGPGPAPGPAPGAAPAVEDDTTADSTAADSTAADGMAADTTPQPAVTLAGATALRAEPPLAAAPPAQGPPAQAPPAAPARGHAAHAAADDPDDDVDDPAPDEQTDEEADEEADDEVPRRRGAHEARGATVDPRSGEPGEEDVEVTDLLLVVDLADEVLVVDEHPRYHVAGCPTLDGRATVPLPMVEARTDGFTPCAACRPVRHLADVERSRRRAARG
ncbi:hypothetical protein SAMN06893096_104264 [Geodermatophilus pulveris]|uniref:Uncharacterized protein n=1 Tax=Geodermatophilus pulveris TaxID=1564159 RepID=A0A239ES01_9ACTN|nr:hypothetical protein [Geodermatophilus pulveris]SNS47191.1 hypothetical protein SAMN06893096_104264 [Geodermatophilus pulveris]